MFVIGAVGACTLVAIIMTWGGPVFGAENERFGDLSLTEQIILVAVIPGFLILAGILPWHMGGFSLSQSLVLSIGAHIVTIGLSLVMQSFYLTLAILVTRWIVLPVAIGRE